MPDLFIDIRVQPPTMLERDWNELGERLFGKDQTLWRFKCPACGNVMSGSKARALPADKLAKLRAGDYRLEQECIGRHLPEDVDCNWCAYGLFSGPFFVVRPGGGRTPVFGFDIEAQPKPTEARPCPAGFLCVHETLCPGAVR